MFLHSFLSIHLKSLNNGGIIHILHFTTKYYPVFVALILCENNAISKNWNQRAQTVIFLKYFVYIFIYCQQSSFNIILQQIWLTISIQA